MFVARRHRGTFFSLVVGIGLFGASIALVSEHVHAIVGVRDTAVPLIAQLTDLRYRQALLHEQVELTQLQSALRIGSQEEQVRTYVLPNQPNTDRIIALFDVLSLLPGQHAFIGGLSPITIGDAFAEEEGVLQTIPISVQCTVRRDGLERMLNFFRLSGVLTVADALRTDEIAMILAQVEAVDPAGIVALEQFFSTDLLEYAREPDVHEDQLLKGFSSPDVLEALRQTLQTSLLHDARMFLGDALGDVLEQQGLWPLPFLLIRDVQIQPGGAAEWFRVSLTLHAYHRSLQE